MTTLPQSMGSGYRGQTEPFAAVVAVAALAIGLSFYAVASEDVISEFGSDELGEEAVLETVWQSLSEGGVIQADEQPPSETLAGTPLAHSACISLFIVTDDGSESIIEQVHLSEDGEATPAIDHSGCSQSDSSVLATEQRTLEHNEASRNVPVRLSPDETRPGGLHIEVQP